MRTLIAIFLLAVPAYAQKKPVKPAPAPKAQVINIEDPDVIGGETPSGQGEVISVIKRAPKPGMIKIRENFLPEMYTTALNL